MGNLLPLEIWTSYRTERPIGQLLLWPRDLGESLTSLGTDISATVKMRRAVLSSCLIHREIFGFWKTQEPLEEGKLQVPAGVIQMIQPGLYHLWLRWTCSHPQQSDWWCVCGHVLRTQSWPRGHVHRNEHPRLPAMTLPPSVLCLSPSQKCHQEHFTVLAAVFHGELYFII